MMEAVAGVVLAGGRGTRMEGRDKALVPLGGRPLAGHVLARLRPQVGTLAVNANGDPARFGDLECPVLPDTVGGHPGPLAGILAGIGWAARIEGTTHLLSVSVDTPFLPGDLADRLAAAATDARIAVAASSGRRHPVCALWPLGLRLDLEAFLADPPSLAVSAFLERHETVEVAFPAHRHRGRALDPFFNVNDPADLAEAEAILRETAR